MTFDQFDQDELLAFIEGELGQDEAAAMEHELSNAPRAAMFVERMRRDRELLRTEREPDIPRNFLPSIESRLARPMLMETLREAEEDAEITEAFATTSPSTARPGAMRRQHRRLVLRRRLTRLAIAAMLTIAVGAGAWTILVATNLNQRAVEWLAAWQPSPAEESTERTQTAMVGRDDDNDNAIAIDAEKFTWPDGAIVHHQPPSSSLWTGVDGADAPSTQARGDRAGDRETAAIQLKAILVMRTDDPASVEAHLTRVMQELTSPAALVQNFSYEEATRLAEAWTRGRDAEPHQRATGRPLRAEAGTDRSSQATSDRIARLADDARRQLRLSHGGGSLDEVEPSLQLADSRDLAATFAEQLDYSSRGATHTITIRAGALHDLLAALNRASSAETMLMHLPEPERANELLDGAAHRPWLMHLREFERVRSQIDELADDALIHMPVRVEPVTGGSSLR